MPPLFIDKKKQPLTPAFSVNPQLDNPDAAKQLFAGATDLLRPAQKTAEIQSQRKMSLLPTAIKEIKTKQSIAGGAIPITRDPQLFVNDKERYAAVPFGGVAGTAKRVAPKAFSGFKDLTTRLLEDLKGRSTVAKQYIIDATNRPELKQVERDIFRMHLQNEGDVVNVPNFAKKIKSELLPLERISATEDLSSPRYENISLPDELRGPIANYDEHIYQSPIKTSAGDVHYAGMGGYGNTPDRYFAHTRIEDLPSSPEQVFPNVRESWRKPYLEKNPITPEMGSTRRVIEIQSDLFQKGRLESELPSGPADYDAMSPEEYAKVLKGEGTRAKEIAKLEPYRNTWHERVIREEVKKAAEDGKTKLQFPTGETAMKIEGLGEQTQSFFSSQGDTLYAQGVRGGSQPLKYEDLKVGQSVWDRTQDNWIITDVLGDGKFKAVPKSTYDTVMKGPGEFDWRNSQAAETFDISGKVDTSNPIYRFYEKEVGRYLMNKYEAKVITDPRGVKWYEINVGKAEAKKPIQAFGKTSIGTLIGGAGASGLAAAAVAAAQPTKLSYTRQENPLLPQTYHIPDRGVNITDSDLQEARKILFAEISNRSPERQVFETKIILNTAINRMKQYKERGINKTLTQVLQEPNQYQGYGSKQYNIATTSKFDPLSKKKMQTIDTALDEIKTTGLPDNTNGSVFYVHNKDGSITLRNGPLFAE